MWYRKHGTSRRASDQGRMLRLCRVLLRWLTLIQAQRSWECAVSRGPLLGRKAKLNLVLMTGLLWFGTPVWLVQRRQVFPLVVPCGSCLRERVIFRESNRENSLNSFSHISSRFATSIDEGVSALSRIRQCEEKSSMTVSPTRDLTFLSPRSFRESRARDRFLDGRFEIDTMLSLGSGYRAWRMS